MKQLFFNCQTLGRRPGCGIVEVGFATFDDLLRQSKEQRITGEILISVEQNLRYNRTSDADTLKWWIEKQGGLRPSLRMPKRENASMPQLLSELASQWDELWHKKHIRTIWCKHPTFHIDILNSAYDDLKVERPILLREENFRGWRCASTAIKSFRWFLDMPITGAMSSENYGKRALLEAELGAIKLEDSFVLMTSNRVNKHRLNHLESRIQEVMRENDVLGEENGKLNKANARLRKSKSKARSR